MSAKPAIVFAVSGASRDGSLDIALRLPGRIADRAREADAPPTA